MDGRWSTPPLPRIEIIQQIRESEEWGWSSEGGEILYVIQNSTMTLLLPISVNEERKNIFQPSHGRNPPQLKHLRGLLKATPFFEIFTKPDPRSNIYKNNMYNLKRLLSLYIGELYKWQLYVHTAFLGDHYKRMNFLTSHRVLYHYIEDTVVVYGFYRWTLLLPIQLVLARQSIPPIFQPVKMNYKNSKIPMNKRIYETKQNTYSNFGRYKSNFLVNAWKSIERRSCAKVHWFGLLHDKNTIDPFKYDNK